MQRSFSFIWCPYFKTHNRLILEFAFAASLGTSFT
jgi:hypothetical protein